MPGEGGERPTEQEERAEEEQEAQAAAALPSQRAEMEGIEQVDLDRTFLDSLFHVCPGRIGFSLAFIFT
jgi:hypothetical protein